MRQNWTFTLSLILHAMIAWWLIHANPGDMLISEAPIQIEIRDKEPKKTVSMDPSMGEVLKQVKDQAKRWSKENRRVQQETSALGLDQKPMTQMGSNNSQQQQERQKNKRSQSNYSMQDPENHEGIRTSREPEEESKLNPLLQSNGALRSVVTGQSTRGEFIPGLAQGSFTALNTDQFTYYTFFARMNEQIRPRWISRLRDFAMEQNQFEMQKLAEFPRTTQVEFILDNTGKLLDVVVHLTSGFRKLDFAGTDAFKDAAPINNPPQGLVGQDGKIHLYYNFTVQWRE